MKRVWEGAGKGWESRLTGKQGDKERRLNRSIWTATEESLSQSQPVECGLGAGMEFRVASAAALSQLPSL